MKILVFGSKGFIGQHVFRHFCGNVLHDVYGSDVVVDYPSKNYFQIDAANSDYQELFQQAPFDVCINCSGAASVPDSLVHPQRDFLLNTANVYKMLDAIRKYAPLCRFLNLSSAAVYGNPYKLPIQEDDKCKPVSPYGFHKLQAEQICQEFHLFFGLPTCSIRIFSAFGPGLKKQLFWDWAQRIKLSGNIALYGTGEESRDFIYIDDLLQAISCVVTGGDFSGETINVANGTEIFIKDAIGVFQKNSLTPFEYSFNGETRSGDPINWRADISRLSALGYVQQTSFEEGIKNYIRWLREEG